MTFYHKPSAFVRLMNGAISFLASRGLTPGSTITLEVKGRKSGQTRSTVVNSVEHEGQRYLVSPRGETEWVRNVRAAHGEAAIRHGKLKPVRLDEVADETAPILQAYLKSNAMATKSHFGIDPNAPLSEFERVASRHPVFLISER